jgi:hypothetical protein
VGLLLKMKDQSRLENVLYQGTSIRWGKLFLGDLLQAFEEFWIFG